MSRLVLEMTVLGKPEPQGSATAWVPMDKAGNPFRRESGGKGKGSIVVNVTSDNKALKAWREAIEAEALGIYRPVVDEHTGFAIELISYLKRPEGHWGTGRNASQLKAAVPAYPTTIPDADKLLRAVMDGLTGVVWKDDSQVTDAATRKRYAVPTASSTGVCAVVRVWANEMQAGEQLPIDQRVRVVRHQDAGPPEGDLTLL